MIHRDLLFREDPSVLSEVGTDGTGTEGLGMESEDSGWDNMIQTQTCQDWDWVKLMEMKMLYLRH